MGSERDLHLKCNQKQRNGYNIGAMSYKKKKPYRHKGPSVVNTKSGGSDASMVKKKRTNRSQSNAYKDHIDGA